MRVRNCGNGGPWWPAAVGIGAAMGAATGDMAMWLSLGAGVGLALFGAGRRGRG